MLELISRRTATIFACVPIGLGFLTLRKEPARGSVENQGCLNWGYRVTVRFKLIALIYGSIISSLSKSGIDAGNLRAPRSAERWLSFLGWLPFFIKGVPMTAKPFLSINARVR